MTQRVQTIPAGEFKAKCLKLMEQVNMNRAPIIITKRGLPIAKLVPIEATSFDVFGCLKDSVTINEDIIQPIDVGWDADV